jgi:uncharacterized protein (TIGR02246 family)
MRKLALIVAIGTLLMVSGALAETKEPSADEIAVRRTIASYVEAYNRADTHAMASYWGSQGTYVSPSGDEEAKGPEKIQQALAAFFAKNKDVRLKVTISSIHMPSPDRAIVKGIAAYQSQKEEPEEAAFVATLTKEKGGWKLLVVDEDESPDVEQTQNHLKELAWLIGEWVDSDENASVDTTFRWTKNFSFISGSFTVSVKDRISLEGTQVIGWDPATKQIRSWIFDSSGSFGQGIWSHEGNRWTVKMSSILSTGEKASAVNIYTLVDANTFTWQSIGREVGGVLLPNIDEVTVVRKPAQEK